MYELFNVIKIYKIHRKIIMLCTFLLLHTDNSSVAWNSVSFFFFSKEAPSPPLSLFPFPGLQSERLGGDVVLII